jgi:hypothetical protein
VYILATGGFTVQTGAGATGAKLDAGTPAWASLCTREAKDLDKEADAARYLEGIKSLKVYEYTYKGVPNIRHVGPVAEDWHEIFPQEGKNKRRIDTMAFDGVQLAAIKALAHQVDALANDLAAETERATTLETRLATLADDLATEKARTTALEAQLAARE